MIIQNNIYWIVYIFLKCTNRRIKKLSEEWNGSWDSVSGSDSWNVVGESGGSQKSWLWRSDGNGNSQSDEEEDGKLKNKFLRNWNR